MKSRYTLLLYLIFFINSLFAQNNNIAIGQWRLHLPNNNSSSTVEAVGKKIYSASPLGMFYIDESNNYNILSKIQGLSDVGVSKIKYNNLYDILLIAYENGNIDILKGDEIINISDILRKSIPGSKKINHINFNGDFAYLSADFGLAILNLKKLEIKETIRNLSADGLQNRIYSSTVNSNDSIFLSTDNGIMVSKIDASVNLLDYFNWYTYTTADSVPAALGRVAALNNKVFAGFTNTGVYYLEGKKWIKTPLIFPTLNTISDMRVSNNKLLVSYKYEILELPDEKSFKSLTNKALEVQEAVYDPDGKLWAATLQQGLVSNKENNFEKTYAPNGPYTEKVFSLSYYNNKIIAVPGGWSAGYIDIGDHSEKGFYTFENDEWTNFLPSPTGPRMISPVEAVYNPLNNKVYIASFGNGLVEWDQGTKYTLYTEENSGLTNPFPNPPRCGSCLYITGTAVDKKGNVWTTSTELKAGDSSLTVKRPDGTWNKFSFGDKGRYTFGLVIDDSDNKWIRVHPNILGGIIVFNEKLNKSIHLTSGIGSGNLPSTGVLALAKDKKGEIWVGTNKGIAVYYNPASLFTGNSIDAGKPIFDGFPLLFDEQITTIKVDGGNRKWIGTTNGLWLFNEDGTEVVLHFTAENSPLISNNILDVEINDLTGEVFIATDKGIISYRGTATEGEKTYANVKVFPNPINSKFTGTVGISGLATDANVKITDIFGNLVYETRAQGGSAVWNVKDYNGKRADTGIYLIFCSTEDGETAFVSKVAVVE